MVLSTELIDDVVYDAVHDLFVHTYNIDEKVAGEIANAAAFAAKCRAEEISKRQDDG